MAALHARGGVARRRPAASTSSTMKSAMMVMEMVMWGLWVDDSYAVKGVLVGKKERLR